MATSPAPGTCTTFPAIAGAPTRPASIRNEATRAWDSGANSTKQLDGNLQLAFTQPQVQGAAMGFTATRESPENYSRITHGFLFGTDAVGRPVFCVLESGRTLTDFAPYVLTDVFRINRVDGNVAYYKNTDLVLLSEVASSGALMAGCTLFASGDVVESEEAP